MIAPHPKVERANASENSKSKLFLVLDGWGESNFTNAKGVDGGSTTAEMKIAAIRIIAAFRSAIRFSNPGVAIHRDSDAVVFGPFA